MRGRKAETHRAEGREKMEQRLELPSYTPRMACSNQEPGARQGRDFPLDPPGEIKPVNTLILAFWPPELTENKVL